MCGTRIDAGHFSVNGEFDASEIDRFMPAARVDANGPMRFNVSREAGTLEIEGTLKSSAGSGTFRFVPSQTFIAGLTARGFSRPTAQQLFALAQNDIGFEFIDELAAQKYARPDIRSWCAPRITASASTSCGRWVRPATALERSTASFASGITAFDPDYVRGCARRA